MSTSNEGGGREEIGGRAAHASQPEPADERHGRRDEEAGHRRELADADAAGPSEQAKTEVEKGKAAHLRRGWLREVIESSPKGAPSAGEAVSDLFSTDEIFHRILATADHEFSRSKRLLFLSGLVAGLSVGLTFLARVTFAGALGEDPTGFLENAFYPVGFIFVVLGRQQLFTENTLTPVSLVLMRLSSLPRLLSLWGIVFAANVLGAALMAFLFAGTDILDAAAMQAAYRFGDEAMELGWGTLFVRGAVAGFLVAGMVWLIHAVRDAMTRFAIIYLIFFLIPSMGLFHCIVGACEIAYFVLVGGTNVFDAAVQFEIPVTLGNAVGGVLFVALPNFFQTSMDRFMDWEKLTWPEWFLGRRELAGHGEGGEDSER